MKWIWIPVVLAALTLGVEAKSKDELDLKIRELTARLETLHAKPDKRVPAHLLTKAKGIVLMDRTKAGFVFAYQGGARVAMVRDKKTGAWGPPAFLKADEGSLGFQVGSQKAFVVILLMKEEATRLLTEASRWQLVDLLVRNYDGDMSGVGRMPSTVTDAVLALARELVSAHIAVDKTIPNIPSSIRPASDPATIAIAAVHNRASGCKT